VPVETIVALGVKRVVFSGGEPVLHPALDQILRHYAAHVVERVVITNGLLMDGEMLSRLLAAGATAVAFSVDSVDPERFQANRGLPAGSLARILDNLRDAARQRSFGLGLNAVVTTATAAPTSVRDLLAFAANLQLDFVKFSPVFDDGYLGRNAPHLQLGEADATALDSISELVDTFMPVPSNPAEFWRDLARLVRGERLPGSACGLGDGTALLVPKRLVRCFWVPSADIGPAERVRYHDARTSVQALQMAKSSCAVDARCFCLQPMEHVWTSLSTS
jgi:pyruvate-formate lyase-activating enzyme